MAGVEQILRFDAGVTVLVNKAGIGSVAPLLGANVDDMDSMIELNITALTRLTYAAGPAFVQRGRGTIVNISSVAGIANEVLNGVYSASKSPSRLSGTAPPKAFSRVTATAASC